MKRFIALLVAIPLCVFPSHAWSQESFIGNDYDGSESQAVEDSGPVLYSAAPYDVVTASEDSGLTSLFTLSGVDVASRLSLVEGYETVGLTFYEISEGTENAYVSIPDMYWYSGLPAGGVTANVSCVDSIATMSMPFTSISPKFDEILSIYYAVTDPTGGHSSFVLPNGLYLKVDVSDVAGDITDIEFLGSVDFSFTYYYGSSSKTVSGGSLTIYVNGASTDTSYSTDSGTFQFDNYLYNSTEPITEIWFSVIPDPANVSVGATGALTYGWDMSLDLSNTTFSFLGAASGGVVNTDKVNEEIGQHEDLEADWGGSMVDNFNALDIGNFSYPDGLASAFALVSGIFQDLWYGLGDYAILYVFPLTLAILLLVIGRLSKFGGRSSRASKGEEGG